MTAVRFWNEGADRAAEYLSIRASQPALGNAVFYAIQAVLADPERAARDYSVRLDQEAGYMAMPFLAPDGKTCLVWRNAPDGDDAIEIVDYGLPWGDLDNPSIWPRPGTSVP